MHIKQIIIQGFKSYKEQTALEPFSPGTNVIVGRNGSGKSNFFAAIRFVLSDAYTNLTREERQGLLHEGSGSAVMSAYVEIIFDNTDRRFNEPDDEFVIRRTIGLKKDEYSVNKKVQPRSEVVKALEHAGFAKENPFYIVPQGRVAHITNMKETDRLNLLKEIAGTNTYEDRRVQSLKIMAETNSKREKIDELLDYIKDRLTELEEEKDELRSWQDKDRERKCLEYAYFHHEHERINEFLAEIEEARSENATSETASSIEQRESAMAKMDKRLRDLRQDLELATIERRQLDEDRKSAARAHAKVELTAKHLDETRHAREESQRQREADLEAIQQQIETEEAELAGILPDYQKWKADETKVRTELQAAEAGHSRLMKKQEHGNQFQTKAERDKFLREEISDLTQAIAQLKANGLDNREEVAAGEATIKSLEKEIEKMKANVAGHGGKRAALAEKVSKAQDTREALTEERKQLQREQEKLNALLKSAREERQAAQKDLSKAMDSGTSRGLESIRRLKQEKDLPGAYGTVAELMKVTHDVYRLAVEQTAGNSLFHYVVDNHETSTVLSEHLHKNYGGRVTFIPMQQLRVRQVKMPRAADAQPLISKIEYDPKFEPAFQQIFGKTVICPSLQVCSQYARSHNLNAITPDGDTANRRGAMTGGYIDTRRSRLETINRVAEVRDRFENLETEAMELEERIKQLDQQVTDAFGAERRLDQELTRFQHGFEPLKAELQEKTKQLAREKVSLEAAKGRCANVEEGLNGFDQDMAARQDELETDFKKALSAREERDLEQFTAEVFRLQKQLQEVSKKRRELEVRKNQLEVNLGQNLRPQAEQLGSLGFDAAGDTDGGGGGGGISGGGAGYQDAQRELKKAQKAVAKVGKELQENDKKMEALNSAIAAQEAQRAEVEKEKQDLAEELEKEQRRLRKKIQQKAVLTSQADEWAAKIRDLGVIPEEAFGKYERMKTEQITNRLKKVNEALRKFKHINKKALEQYNNFMTQQDQLLKRRKELDASQVSIEELIQHLDQAKDEAIERTFKQVSREFATIFEQLVPAGHGRLVIQKKTDRDPGGKKTKKGGRKSQAAAEESDDEDHGATEVDNYTGVGISVSFNSKVLDEQQKIQQLSGGQKSLCALCLIFALQAAESSPFVIFDEVDANLDAQYRTAVASLLDSISKTQSTQFICTTFRPEIVLVADKCYGVTFHNKTSTIDCVPTEEALNFVEGQQKK